MQNNISRSDARNALTLVTKAVEQQVAGIREVYNEKADQWTEIQRMSVIRFISSELAIPIENLWHGLFEEKAPWSEGGFIDSWEPEEEPPFAGIESKGSN